MIERISPARAITGLINVPGDKSISHRYAMLASIASGVSEVYNFSTGEDCQSTLSCMSQLGVRFDFSEKDNRSVLTVHGNGTRSLRESADVLDAGNSGSTIRMLSGILAAQSFRTEITGDSSLVKRPMGRIMRPLAEMGACIEARDGQFAPLHIQGSPLHPIDYTLPVASAQVKSCVLLAGLYAKGETVVHEPIKTRDHTEIALREMGADLTLEPRTVRIRGGAELAAKPLVVPGDISSAAFFIVAALMAQEADLTVANVGLNPTRTALLDVLRSMGAVIKLVHIEQINGELIGTLQIKTSRIKGGIIEGAATAAVIDEIPVLAVLGAVSQDGLIIRDAGELRVKETDRIVTIAENLKKMGVSVRTTNESLEIPGSQKLRAATLSSSGDHRIAMAFAVAALSADGECFIEGADAASVSFPEFFVSLREISQS